MDRLAYAVILSWGWRRRGLAFAAGALSALSQPPFFAFPVLWLTFPVLVFLIDGAVTESRAGRLRRVIPAFAVGWWFGFGYFLAGLWWIGAAFLVEADQFGWMLPLAVIGLPAGLALIWGVGTAFAQLLWSDDWRRIFALAAGLGGAEWLRGHILSGFPWNSVGYALTAGEVLMQSAALFGLEALNVIAVLIFAAPATLMSVGGHRGRNTTLPVLALVALCGFGLFGVLRLAQAPTQSVPNVSIRIVQPNLDQLQKRDPENKDEVLSTYYRLSAPEGAPLQPGMVLVWPESAFPFPLTQEPGVLAAIAELLPPETVLATGAYRTESPPGGEEPLYFNSIYVIGPDGAILQAYDKVHLVPFGEYAPRWGWLEELGLRQLVPSGFTAGLRRMSLPLPSGLSFSPLICYEAIFSGTVVAEGPRPAFLLNLTNDGWFGRTIGPRQHFHQARLRSVEEGLPMIRAANTGISAVIDGYGRIVARAGLGESATVDAPLPAAIAPTFYAKSRLLPFIATFGVCLFLAAAAYFYPSPRR